MNETPSKNTLSEKKVLVPQTGSGKIDEAKRTKEIMVSVFIVLAVIVGVIYIAFQLYWTFLALIFF